MTDVLYSRVQFAVTTLFHIVFPLLSVGLSAFLVLVEAMWVRTGDRVWYVHARFWGRILLTNFAVGVASGLVLEFQFGTNWGLFSAATGGFFGSVLGFEATLAFMLEAGFIGVMMFGWNRVSRGGHLFATTMVALGASASAVLIMAANSWMQTPAGGEFRDGVFVTTDYWKAFFNPDMPWAASHMWTACIETTLFLVGGISAWYILKGRHTGFFLRALRAAAAAAILVAPLQIFLGDGSGFILGEVQPAKLAAFEAAWETNPPGQPAGWALLAWPDPERQRNAFEIRIPYLGSILATRTLTGQVRGLREFPREDQPPVAIPFFSFRIMVGFGFLLLFLMLWTVVAWVRGGLREDTVRDRPGLLASWMIAAPLGYLATWFGWVVREVGRQPWVIYNVMRTSEGASGLPGPLVGTSLGLYAAVYAFLLVGFVFFLSRILRHGPDLDLPPPAYGRRGRQGRSA